MQFVLKTNNQNRNVLQPLFRYLIVTIGLILLALWLDLTAVLF